MARNTATVDYQVTYAANAALHTKLRQRLDHHRLVKRVLQTTYLDTPQRLLFQRGITLRDRVQVKPNGSLSTAKTEAKIPGTDGLLRTAGPEAHAAVAKEVGAHAVAAENLRPVATQTKTRQLLLVGGSSLSPDFVVALDTAETVVDGYRSQRCEIEAQLFTALPWTSRVTPERVERFHAFCRQLERDFDLVAVDESGYHAIMKEAQQHHLATRSDAIAGSEHQREVGNSSETNVFEGLTEGAKLRTEALFSSSSQIVVDASHVTMVEHEGLAVVPVAEVFSQPDVTFLGFGKPNVYLVVPRPATAEAVQGWDRFAAFMFWRKAAFVADTKGRVQGGVFLELRNLPPEAIVRLRAAMVSFEGRKTITCANATSRVLTQAGFTCNGRKLTYKVRPMTLAKALWDGGLEYDGEPVTLRIIRTNAGTVSDHFVGVLKKESTALVRAIEKIVKPASSGGVAKAPLITARPLAEATGQVRSDAHHLELRVGRSTKMAVLLQRQIGEHPIFEAQLDPTIADINGPEFAELRTALRAYPGKLDLVSKVKRYVLFSRPVVKLVRYQMAAKMDSLGYLPGPVLVDMFQAGSPGDPFLYNVVITGTSARMTRLENRTEKDVGKANWVLAKHVLLSGYDPDVRYAGEIWVDDTDTGRVMHVNDNSGTYKPQRQQAAAAARFLQQLTGVPVSFTPVGESNSPANPQLTVGDTPAA
jgi:hypothetical protein